MRITYKPGTEVTLGDLGDTWQLCIHQHGWDAENHCQRYLAVYNQIILKSHFPTEESLGPWILLSLQKFELHETREWLRIDGVRVDDPHAPGVDPDAHDPEIVYILILSRKIPAGPVSSHRGRPSERRATEESHPHSKPRS